MKTDREIVEYLDESVCWHEWKERRTGEFEHDATCQKCNLNMIVNDVNCNEAPYKNPTPTLKWMVKMLNTKGYVVELWQSPSQTEHKANIVFYKNKYKGYGVTPTLALRGAVEKLMESEEK